jgi:P27 family predicted phage terminase small subunit
MKEAAVVLQRDGLIQDGTKGERKAPAWQIYRDAFMAFMKSAGEFGLTPAARSNLKVDDGGLVDEFFGY